MSDSYDLIVIGAGPGGYVAAIRAAQLGMKVLCVEKDKTLGGTCLNVGCIPSKALLESSELYYSSIKDFINHGIDIKNINLNFNQMQKRKEGIVTQLTGGIGMLFKKNKVDVLKGSASISKVGVVIVDGGEIRAKSIVIATGSSPVNLPFLKVDQKQILDSTGALALDHIPKTLLVVGGGYIGLEMGSVYARLGSIVTVVEALDKIVPQMDAEVGRALQLSLQKQGLFFKLSTKIKKATVDVGKGVDVVCEGPSGEEKIQVEAVLVSVGRKPQTEGLGLKEVGIKLDARGAIEVDQKFQTSVPGVYAVGDVIRGPMLAHKASEEGVAVAEIIAGQAGHVNYATIPGVVYTHPEVASVGFSEEELKAKGVAYKKSKFPFMANGRALSIGFKEGFVKLLADSKTDRLLGAHIIGPRASDLIAEIVLAMEFSASSEDIARTVHAHPTLAEAVKEAALGLGSGAIHM